MQSFREIIVKHFQIFLKSGMERYILPHCIPCRSRMTTYLTKCCRCPLAASMLCCSWMFCVIVCAMKLSKPISRTRPPRSPCPYLPYMTGQQPSMPCCPHGQYARINFASSDRFPPTFLPFLDFKAFVPPPSMLLNISTDF